MRDNLSNYNHEYIAICTAFPLPECMQQSKKCPLQMIRETGEYIYDDTDETKALIFDIL